MKMASHIVGSYIFTSPFTFSISYEIKGSNTSLIIKCCQMMDNLHCYVEILSKYIIYMILYYLVWLSQINILKNFGR